MFKLYSIISLMLCCCFCSSAVLAKADVSSSDIQSMADLHGQRAPELLNRLKTMKRELPVFQVNASLDDWISLEDVRKLSERLDSKAPCLHIVPAWSSYSSRQYSTEGIQAAYMIDGYINHSYPAVCPRNSESDRLVMQRVRAWLAAHKVLASRSDTRQAAQASVSVNRQPTERSAKVSTEQNDAFVPDDQLQQFLRGKSNRLDGYDAAMSRRPMRIRK